MTCAALKSTSQCPSKKKKTEPPKKATFWGGLKKIWKKEIKEAA